MWSLTRDCWSAVVPRFCLMGVGFGCLSNGSSLRLDGHKVDTEDPNLFLRLLREQHSDVWAEAFERQLVVSLFRDYLASPGELRNTTVCHRRMALVSIVGNHGAVLDED